MTQNYPFNKNGHWHTAIDISDLNVNPLLQGKVVAYRIDSKYIFPEPFQLSVNSNRMHILPDQLRKEFEPTNLPYFMRLPQSGASSQSTFREILSCLQLRVSNCLVILEHEIDYGESKTENKKMIFYSLYANIDPDTILQRFRNFTPLPREAIVDEIPWYVDTELKLTTIPFVSGCNAVLVNILTKAETSVFLPSGISVIIQLDNGKPITHQNLECNPPQISSCKGKEKTHILKIPSSFLNPIDGKTIITTKVFKDAKLYLKRENLLVEVGHVDNDIPGRKTEIGSSIYNDETNSALLYYSVSGLTNPSKLRNELMQAYGYVDSRYLEDYESRKSGVFTIKSTAINSIQNQTPAIVRYKSTSQTQGSRFFDFLSMSEEEYLDSDSYFFTFNDRASGILNARKLSRIYAEESTEPATVWERKKDHKNQFVTMMQLQSGDKVTTLPNKENKEGLPNTVQFKVMSETQTPLKNMQETITFVLVRYSIAEIDSFYVSTRHLTLGTVTTTLKESSALPVINRKSEQGLLFYLSEGSGHPVDFWPRKQECILKIDSIRTLLSSNRVSNFRVMAEVDIELAQRLRGYIPIASRTQLSIKCKPKKFSQGNINHTVVVDGTLQYPPSGVSIYLGSDDYLGVASSTEGIKHQHIEFFMKKDQPFFSSSGRSLRYQFVPSEANIFHVKTQAVSAHYSYEAGTVLNTIKRGYNSADTQIELFGFPGILDLEEGKKDEDYIIETVNEDENRILSFVETETTIPVVFTFNGNDYHERILNTSFNTADIYCRDDKERKYVVGINENIPLFLPTERTDNPETILYSHHSMKCTMENVHGAYRISILGVNMAMQNGGVGSGHYWHRQGVQPTLAGTTVEKDVLSKHFDTYWTTLNAPNQTQAYRVFQTPLVVWLLEDEYKRMYSSSTNTFIYKENNQQRTVRCYLENPTCKEFVAQESKNGKGFLESLNLFDKDENPYFQLTLDNMKYYVDTITRDNLQENGTITTRYGFKLVRPSKSTLDSMLGTNNWTIISNLSTNFEHSEVSSYLATEKGSIPCYSNEPSMVVSVETVGTLGKVLEIPDSLIVSPRVVKTSDEKYYYNYDPKDTKYVEVQPKGDKDYFKFDDYFHMFGKDSIKKEPISIDEMINILSELYSGKDKPATPIEADGSYNRLEIYRNDNCDLLLKSAFEKTSDWCESQAKRFNPSIDYHTQRIELFKKLCIWPESGSNRNLPEPIRSCESLLFFHPPTFLKHLNKAQLYGVYFTYSNLKECLEKAVDRALVKVSGYTICEPRYYMQDTATFCNWFLYDMCKEFFGDDLFKAVFYGEENGVWKTLPKERRAWYYYEAFLENPFLEEMHSDYWTRALIQKEVDEKGTLIIAASTNTVDPGHVGFVAPTSMVIRTMKVGTTEGAAFEGQTIDPKNKAANFQAALPLIAQAGGRNGVMGFNYAFGDPYRKAYEEMYESGNTYIGASDKKEKTVWMRFYRVRRN